MPTQENLRNTFKFIDKAVEHATWLALNDCYGPYDGWGKMERLHAKKILSSFSKLTLGNVSLSRIKKELKAHKRELDLHAPAYRFLVHMQGVYTAEDKDAFNRFMPLFQRKGKAYRVLFDDKVETFENIAYCTYFGRSFFCTVKSENSITRSLLTDFISNNKWTYGGKPTQKSMDMFVDFINNVSEEYGIHSSEDFGQELFFKLMDNAIRDDGRKDFLVRHIIRFYRYGIKNGHLQFFGAPITDKRILFTEKTVTFFLTEYVSKEKTYVFNRRGQSTVGTLITLDVDNIYLRTAVGNLLRSKRVSNEEYRACRKTLTESLGQMAASIGSPMHPFNEDSLFIQIEYYRQLYNGHKYCTDSMSFIKALYLSIDEQVNGDFFRNANVITYGLLTTRKFVKYCDENYSFQQYSPYDDIRNGTKKVFIVKGFNKLRKNLLQEDYIAIDYSCIHNRFYRELAWRATTSSKGRLYRNSFSYTLRHFLPALSRIKKGERYPTPRQDQFTLYDAFCIAHFFNEKSDSPLTYNNYLMNVRDFLHWASGTGALQVEDAAFMILINKKIKQLSTNTPILSDEEITTLTEYFAELSKSNPLYGQALILLNLCVITPLRIGHACSLLLQELQYDNRLGCYVVKSSSKGTYGGNGEIVLGSAADRLISKAITINDKVGLDCHQELLREQLFLYCINQKYDVFTPRKFGTLLKEACSDCKLPNYTSRNLRATYMTKAYIEASDNGYANDFVLKLFSYHKRAGTTLENYVNHSEALAALTERLKRDSTDWQKTIFPDEIAALKDVIAEYNDMIASTEDEAVKAQLRLELRDYEKQLENMTK